MIAFSWGHTRKAAESRVKAQEYIQKSQNPIAAGEYLILVNEQAMKLKNHNLWLLPYGSDWHRPLQVTMRTFLQKNKKWHSLMHDSQHWYREAALQREGRSSTRSVTTDADSSWSQPSWRTKERNVWTDCNTNAWNEISDCALNLFLSSMIFSIKNFCRFDRNGILPFGGNSDVAN